MKFLVILFIFTSTHVWAKENFDSWKKSYAKRAAKRGIPKSFVLDNLKDIVPDPIVIEKDKKQVILDKVIDYKVFIKKWLKSNPSRAQVGREMLMKYADILKKVEKKFGVEKEIIVALWGVETFYGKITGDYDLIRSLATLSFDGRRRKFFELQLNATLRALKQGHVTREKLKGSWAGATGQCQFMPSNIPVYAVDFDGDGKKDIWSTPADIFASIANLLKKAGWKKGKSIGQLALGPKKPKLNSDIYRTKKTYTSLGFTNLDGSKINGNWVTRRFSQIPMKNSPVVLRGGNYKPLLKWNNSSLFAAFNILLVDEFN
jgi:membrane-bound lytic murein transglycosylase B